MKVWWTRTAPVGTESTAGCAKSIVCGWQPEFQFPTSSSRISRVFSGLAAQSELTIELLDCGTLLGNWF
jgi:hypothetical protein